MERPKTCKYLSSVPALGCLVHIRLSVANRKHDSYRLFGRRVLRNRNCSGMNVIWRTTLRTRSLASVRIHRNPPKRTLQPTVPLLHWVVTQLVTQPLPLQSVKPYFHIIFKKECAEPWMTKFESDIPKTPRNWLADRGFNGMEHFDVRVGVEI